jgi:hypothetical protein
LPGRELSEGSNGRKPLQWLLDRRDHALDKTRARSSRTIFDAGSRRFTMSNNIAWRGFGRFTKASVAAI